MATAILENDGVRKAIMIAGGVAVVGGVGLIIYAVVWAVNTKIFKVFSEYFGFLKGLITALTAHPMLWISLIATAVAAVIGGPTIMKAIEYIRAQRALRNAKELENDRARIDGRPNPNTQESIMALDPLISDEAVAQELGTAKVAQLAESEMTNAERAVFNNHVSELQRHAKAMEKIISDLRPGDTTDRGLGDAMRDGEAEMNKLKTFTEEMLTKYGRL